MNISAHKHAKAYLLRGLQCGHTVCSKHPALLELTIWTFHWTNDLQTSPDQDFQYFGGLSSSYPSPSCRHDQLPLDFGKSSWCFFVSWCNNKLKWCNCGTCAIWWYLQSNDKKVRVFGKCYWHAQMHHI